MQRLLLGLLLLGLSSAPVHAAIITLSESDPSFALVHDVIPSGDAVFAWHFETQGFMIDARDMLPVGLGGFTTRSDFALTVSRLDHTPFRVISASVSWGALSLGPAETPFVNGSQYFGDPASQAASGAGTIDFAPTDPLVLTFVVRLPPTGIAENVVLRSLTVETVPEPATLALVAVGLTMAWSRRRTTIGG